MKKQGVYKETNENFLSVRRCSVFKQTNKARKQICVYSHCYKTCHFSSRFL